MTRPVRERNHSHMVCVLVFPCVPPFFQRNNPTQVHFPRFNMRIAHGTGGGLPSTSDPSATSGVGRLVGIWTWVSLTTSSLCCVSSTLLQILNVMVSCCNLPWLCARARLLVDVGPSNRVTHQQRDINYQFIVLHTSLDHYTFIYIIMSSHYHTVSCINMYYCTQLMHVM